MVEPRQAGLHRPGAVREGRGVEGPSLRRWLTGVLVLVLFLLAVRLLATSVGELSPWLAEHLPDFLQGPASTLAAGWLATYVLMNGSVIAALALTLFVAGVVTLPQLYLLIVGSRLGAASFVILVGALDHLHERRGPLRASLELGLLTFLVTHTLYLPAGLLGYGVLGGVDRGIVERLGDVSLTLPGLEPTLHLTSRVTDAMGGLPTFLAALALLTLSVRLFDRLLDEVDLESVRDRWLSRLHDRRISFCAGVAITGATTSVAFSIGAIVPLYNRRWIRREEVVPYVMGANLGTLADTLVVALVLGTSLGVGAVLLLAVSLTVTVLAGLIAYRPYLRLVAALDARMTGSREGFAVTVLLLLLVPLALFLA